MVASVTDGGPAAKAQIHGGDVILKFNNADVHDMQVEPFDRHLPLRETVQPLRRRRMVEAVEPVGPQLFQSGGIATVPPARVPRYARHLEGAHLRQRAGELLGLPGDAERSQVFVRHGGSSFPWNGSERRSAPVVCAATQ